MIKSTQAHNPQAEYARQLFLFSYYCFGMSFIDMAYLTSDNIVSQNGIDYIVYKRHKIQHQKMLFQFIFNSMNQFKHS